MNEQTFNRSFEVNQGSNTVLLDFRLARPRLWWPSGSGEAYLYHLRLQISDTSYLPLCFLDQEAGIRKIELVSNKDKWGRSFWFKVNGRPVFAKGANYIPQDIFQTDAQDHGPLLNDVKRCGINMLRVWGGGRYESDTFYKLCDSLGIMVWQDFMFACGMVPGDSTFRENVKEEAEQQVTRLSRYACIALWCGNNEINEAWNRWGWQTGLSQENRERLWSDYQAIFNGILPDAVNKYSNHTSYWESSPLYGRGDERFRQEGDAHDWGVWHDEMKFEVFEERVPRFMSEAGFQALPSMTTLKRFCPEDQLELESAPMLAHQKHPRGNKLIYTYLRRDLPEPRNFESLVYLNQVNQAEGIGIAIRAHRRAMPYCMGTMYWQLNDCWPGISWSGMDYYGHWKALQHKVAHLYQPVLLTAKENSGKVELFASSDLAEPTDVKVRISLQDMEESFLLKDSLQLKIKPGQSVKIYSTDLSKTLLDRRKNVLAFCWKYAGRESEDLLFLDRLKHVEFKKPFFKISEAQTVPGGFAFSLTSDRICKAVFLKEFDDLRFFPNFFDLTPGRTIRIFCRTTSPHLNAEDIQITSLFDHLNNP